MTQITLSWGNAGSIEQGFRIYRSESPFDGSEVPIGTVSHGQDKFIDNDSALVEGTKYFYRIASFVGSTETTSETIEFIPVSNRFFTVTTSTASSISNFNPEWSSSQHISIKGVSSTTDNKLIVSSNYTLRTLGATAGDFQYEIPFTAVIEDFDHNFIHSKEIVVLRSGDIIYIDQPSGTAVWSRRLPSTSTYATCATEGNVIVASQNATLYSLDKTGATVWDYTASSNVTAMSCTDTFIVVGGFDGSIERLDLSGVQEWTSSLSGNIEKILIGEEITAYSSDNIIHRLTLSGDVKWSKPFPNITDISIDINGTIHAASSGEITILDGNGDVVSSYTGTSGYLGISNSHRSLLSEPMVNSNLSYSYEYTRDIVGYEDYNITSFNLSYYSVTTPMALTGQSEDYGSTEVTFTGFNITTPMTYGT